jgi:hypothetical protein
LSGSFSHLNTLKNDPSVPNQVFGNGAALQFGVHGVPSFAALPMIQTPVAVIGYGAAGILVTHTLLKLGFSNVAVYERKNAAGIWSQEHVWRGSRNNPNSIRFFSRQLTAAPGPGTEVRDFLFALQQDTPLRITTTSVKEITPGNLHHVLKFTDGKEASYPIVINCVGLGKPAPINFYGKMRTKTSLTDSGFRWQRILNKDEARKKRFVLIGLGNSTAEMLRQFHSFQDAGIELEYKVLTHYPEDAIHNPDSETNGDDRNDLYKRIFRDTSASNLVDYQGDLPLSKYDYFRALNNGHIIAGVKEWERKGKKIVARDQDGKLLAAIPFDELYTLIGYKHDQETYETMGCAFDSDNECALYDYDGELQKDVGAPSERLFRGYFGFGSILDAPWNRNAIVIPGMVNQIGDLVFSVLMRAGEYRNKNN